jgi:hypothetical protein
VIYILLQGFSSFPCGVFFGGFLGGLGGLGGLSVILNIVSLEHLSINPTCICVLRFCGVSTLLVQRSRYDSVCTPR